MFGIESQFLSELKWQTIFCQKAAQSSVKREQVLQEIQRYVEFQPIRDENYYNKLMRIYYYISKLKQ